MPRDENNVENRNTNRNSKLSNFDMPEIITAAAEWASASEYIRKITLHRFKPEFIENEDPLWTIFIWVSPDIDTNTAPWREQLQNGERRSTLTRVKNEYRDEKGKIDQDKICEHPLYSLWHLYEGIADPYGQGRKRFFLFYKNNIDTKYFYAEFDWLVLLENIGNNMKDFLPEGIYCDLDTSDIGSMVLFPLDESPSTTIIPKSKALPVPCIETPEGTTWRDLKFTIMDFDRSENVMITYIPTGKTLANKSPHALGFRGHGGHAGHGRLWSVLIEFAKNTGEFHIENSSDKKRIAKDVSDFRLLLRKLCPGIKEDPLPPLSKRRKRDDGGSPNSKKSPFLGEGWFARPVITIDSPHHPEEKIYQNSWDNPDAFLGVSSGRRVGPLHNWDDDPDDNF